MSILIRPATSADAAAIAEIFNYEIRNGVATWLPEPVSVENWEAWLAEHVVFVAESDGQVVGFAGYGQYRPSPGYRFTVENSIYIRQGWHGQGIARQLMLQLIETARDNGMRVMLAMIEAGNVGSIALHSKLGFQSAGLLQGVGDKHDRVLDLKIMQLSLVKDL